MSDIDAETVVSLLVMEEEKNVLGVVIVTVCELYYI